jgi:uncharacterized membrane protein
VERRLDSIDLLRGVAMILISLDHVRDYFTYLRFSPEDITHTWLALFITPGDAFLCAVVLPARGTRRLPVGSAWTIAGGGFRALWTRGLCREGEGPRTGVMLTARRP